MHIAHETHQGVVRTKQFLSNKFYWPNMDIDIERMIRNCNACVLNQPLHEDQPLQPLELPPRPWTKLGIDLVGPIGNLHILTVIDYYTSYPEAIVLSDISSQSVIGELMKIFARFGYPLEVVTDNGRQFVAHLFEDFLETCGIKHIRASPYYPKSNGKIDGFHRYLKKAFRSAKCEGTGRRNCQRFSWHTVPPLTEHQVKLQPTLSLEGICAQNYQTWRRKKKKNAGSENIMTNTKTK